MCILQTLVATAADAMGHPSQCSIVNISHGYVLGTSRRPFRRSHDTHALFNWPRCLVASAAVHWNRETEQSRVQSADPISAVFENTTRRRKVWTFSTARHFYEINFFGVFFSCALLHRCLSSWARGLVVAFPRVSLRRLGPVKSSRTVEQSPRVLIRKKKKKEELICQVVSA